jgi:hypothetical protein
MTMITEMRTLKMTLTTMTITRMTTTRTTMMTTTKKTKRTMDNNAIIFYNIIMIICAALKAN